MSICLFDTFDPYTVIENPYTVRESILSHPASAIPISAIHMGCLGLIQFSFISELRII